MENLKADQLRDDLHTCGVVLLACAVALGWLGGGWWWLAAVYVAGHACAALSAKI